MINCIMNRRSIRVFKSHPVEKAKIDAVLRAAMQAPSAGNTQCWEFLVVTREEAKKAVSAMSPYAAMAADAPVLILSLVNLKKARSDALWWVEDLSAATQNMLLQLEEEGLGGVWLGIWPLKDRTQALSDYFSLPPSIVPFSVVACGYKGEDKPFEDRYDEMKVHWERY